MGFFFINTEIGFLFFFFVVVLSQIFPQVNCFVLFSAGERLVRQRGSKYMELAFKSRRPRPRHVRRAKLRTPRESEIFIIHVCQQREANDNDVILSTFMRTTLRDNRQRDSSSRARRCVSEERGNNTSSPTRSFFCFFFVNWISYEV